MIAIVARRGFFMVLGYALAVLVATTVVCAAFGLPSLLPDQGRYGSFYSYVRDFPMMFMVGGMMTALYALPGWLITVTFAEWRFKQGRFWFAFSGVATAALAILIAGRFQHLFSEVWLIIAILIGGFCGGLAYWALAGKTSGNWRQTS